MFSRFPKASKYKAQKTVIDGISFASKLESNCYEYLKSMFPDVELQPVFVLQPKFRKDGKAYREIKYIADFKININGKEIIIDSKGMETTDFKIKEKLLLYTYPDINFYKVSSLKALKELILFLTN